MATVPEEVFVFRIGNLGDTLVALPAVHRIAQLHKGARMTLITNAPAHKGMVTAWDVLKHTGLFSRVIFYERNHPLQLARLAYQCRQAHDPILYYLTPSRTLRQVQRDRVFFQAACGFRRIKALSPSPTASERDATGKLVWLPRECDRLLTMVDPEGSPVQDPPFLMPPEAAHERAAELLAPIAHRPIIAFGPGSKMPAKKWFLDRYVALVQRLVDEHPEVGVAVFGGSEDHEDGETLVAAAGADRAVNVAGAANIIESAAALARCKLYIGNDTGTMHLAASVGTSCVAIFSARDNPGRWEPAGAGHLVLRRDVPCAGCVLSECTEHQNICLTSIPADEVLAAAVARLATASNAA
jgi:ADP-heptose:LPS heptosyltransferase